MRKILVRSMMFISSYSPLYLFLLILQYDNYHKTLTVGNKFLGLFVAVMFIFILISIYSMYILKVSSGANRLVVGKVKRANDSVISYVFTYIIPVLSFSLDSVPIILVNLLLFMLIWFLYIKLNLMYLNPLWALQGYIAYEMDDNYIITDMMVDDIKRREGKTLKGFFLVNGIFVAKKKDN